MKKVTIVTCLAAFALVGCLSASAPPERPTGYQHHGSPVTVRLVVLPPGDKAVPADWRVDGYGWNVTVVPEVKIGYPRDLIPISQNEYDRKIQEEGLPLPNWRLLAPTVVFRYTKGASEPQTVAASGRRFSWPDGFQLMDGDVIWLREVDGY